MYVPGEGRRKIPQTYFSKKENREMKNTENKEIMNEGQWAKEQFETRFKKELETAGFKIVKGSGKWGKSAKMVIRDKKGFDRIASGENGEIGYIFIADCVRLLDRWKAVQELERLFPQMAAIGWHCDPVFDMVKSFDLVMHDGTEREIPLTQLGIHKLEEDMNVRMRENKIVEAYPQMAELGWEVDFTQHLVRIEDKNNYGYSMEKKKKYNIYDYHKEEDFEELIAYFDKIVELMG